MNEASGPEPDEKGRTLRRRGLLKAGGVGVAAAAGVALARASSVEAMGLTPMRAFDVKDFGAAGNGSADDTGSIQDAVDAAAKRGGIVFFPPGTYRVRTVGLKTGVHVRGSGIDATVLRLDDSADGPVFESEGFGNLTGTDSAGGITAFSIRDLTIDGNKTENKSGSGLRIYGFGYELTEIVVHNCKDHGIYSEWGSTGSIGDNSHEMDARFSGVRTHTNDGAGVLFLGPHDSLFANCLAFHNGAAGFHFTGVSHGCQLTNLHSWGAEQDVGFRLDALAISCSNCYGDLDGGTGVLITQNECLWIGGRIIGSRGEGDTEEIGVSIGSTSSAGVSGTIVDTYVQNCRTAAVYLPSAPDGAPGGDGGYNVIKARLYQEGLADDELDDFQFVRGTIHPTTQIEVTQGVRDTARNRVVFPAFDLRAESSPTPAPPPESARLYCRLEGGKTQLCVRFEGGEAQVIAEEP